MRKPTSVHQAGPDHYILIANSIEWSPHTTGLVVAETLAKHSVWLASQYTPFRRDYKHGDRVLLYVAGPGARYLVGDAVVAGPVTGVTPADARLAEELGLDTFHERIPLDNVRLWEKPLLLKPLVGRLDFVKDKRNWGLNLRQAAARIPEHDYRVIMDEMRKAVG